MNFSEKKAGLIKHKEVITTFTFYRYLDTDTKKALTLTHYDLISLF